MKKHTKILALFMAIIMIITAIPMMACAATYGDLTYTVTNGEAYITGCTSSATIVEIPSTIDGYPVKFINDQSFSYNSAITSVTIPDSVTSIGEYAFYHCTSLTSINLGKGLTSIGESAFVECYSLTNINLGNNITSIGPGAFFSCTSLTSITIPNSITSIEDRVFSFCTSLSNVTIPDSVTKIGLRSFSDCTSLERIDIPKSVESIGFQAFEGCSALRDVYYAGTEQEWNIIKKESEYIGFDPAKVKIHYSDTCSHSFTEAKGTVNATCTQDGTTGEIRCKACGKLISSDKVIPAKGHTAGSWVVVTPAKVGVKGLEQQKCTVCNTVLNQRDIAALPEASKPDTKPEITYIKGDSNGDGKITAADARIALRISAKLEKIESYNIPVAALDVNGDGKLTAADARKILRISAKLEK